jgi:hypothetical protein
VGGAYGTNEGEEERVEVIGMKGRGKIIRKTRGSLVDNIKMGLAEIKLVGVD